MSTVDRCGSGLQGVQESVFFKRSGLVGRYNLQGNVFRFQRVRVVAEQAARVLKNLLKLGDFLRLEHTKSAGKIVRQCALSKTLTMYVMEGFTVISSLGQ
ncbi:hypothetical protein LB561_14160 [Mesorhizobium sp. B292B1B]|uniref:hypothetical protein n=1 Tax=unclassified Mesorhizobium TaxID=325217 RepID=UPI0011297B4C|nr:MULTISPECIES: hypothetical protein [unclassified Mesorhizobium]MCA0016366.1 hypothetical protein [Mesorhizobium sp. B294B1A1]MCA0038413.1 hypothetical protein [Mesorhizobium sp. B292B1B]TPM37353.1 hypothetical protein FJ964_29970 [Mesorhizobium sp. B2-3-2]